MCSRIRWKRNDSFSGFTPDQASISRRFFTAAANSSKTPTVASHPKHASVIEHPRTSFDRSAECF
jgi:microsomal dipeptidase-like Zn-dependent dipeptidase